MGEAVCPLPQRGFYEPLGLAVAVLMGIITGVFGGVLRDIVCDEIPSAFKDHRPYSVCAFIGGWVYVGFWHFAVPGWLALLVCVSVTAGQARVEDCYVPSMRMRDGVLP